MNERDLSRRGWRCPDEMRLAAYADGRLAASDRERLSKHLAGCEYCLGQVATLAKLAEMPPVEVSADLMARAAKLVPRAKLVPDSAPAGRSQQWRWAVAATATAALVLVIVPMLRQPLVTPPVSVADSEPRVVRQAPSATSRPEIKFPAEGETVAAPDLEFRWSGMDGALFYELTVVTFEGDVAWQGQVDSTHARLPVAIVLMPGRRYYVSVSAFLAQGKTVKSPPIGFAVAAGR
jgi:hypothetical protein